MTAQPEEAPAPDPDTGTSQEEADPPTESTQPLDRAVEPGTEVIEAGAHA
ncbi:hypothetical protein [Aeromicrobium sp. Root495]|nr:hypothetical protein [Aeromicrobium sp. Root495]